MKKEKQKREKGSELTITMFVLVFDLETDRKVSMVKERSMRDLNKEFGDRKTF